MLFSSKKKRLKIQKTQVKGKAFHFFDSCWYAGSWSREAFIDANVFVTVGKSLLSGPQIPDEGLTGSGLFCIWGPHVLLVSLETHCHPLLLIGLSSSNQKIRASLFC